MAKITDKYGLELHEGDTVCFTLSMRIDQKPIVKATIAGFLYGKTNWIVPEYIEDSDVEWGRKEGKLPAKVASHRVVKCY